MKKVEGYGIGPSFSIFFKCNVPCDNESDRRGLCGLVGTVEEQPHYIDKVRESWGCLRMNKVPMVTNNSKKDSIS